MLLSSVFKTFLLREIDASNHAKIKGRPKLFCGLLLFLFALIRMQFLLAKVVVFSWPESLGRFHEM